MGFTQKAPCGIQTAFWNNLTLRHLYTHKRAHLHTNRHINTTYTRKLAHSHTRKHKHAQIIFPSNTHYSLIIKKWPTILFSEYKFMNHSIPIWSNSSCSLLWTNTHAQTNATYTHSNVFLRTHMHAHIIHSQTYEHTHTKTHLQLTFTRTHTFTRARARAHIYTYTQAHHTRKMHDHVQLHDKYSRMHLHVRAFSLVHILLHM